MLKRLYILSLCFLLAALAHCGGGGGSSSSGSGGSDSSDDSGTVVGGNPGDTPVFDEAILDEDTME